MSDSDIDAGRLATAAVHAVRARVMLMILALISAALPGLAQESAPASRREFWGLTRVAAAPDLRGLTVVAEASLGGDTITFFADGTVYYDVEMTYHSDVVGTPPEISRYHWMGRVPPGVVSRAKELAASQRALGRPVSMDALFDLARFPWFNRGKTVPHMVGADWSVRHQEVDGSWSPSDFVFQCDERDAPVCTGVGKEEFRVAATALFAITFINAGYSFAKPCAYRASLQSIMVFLLTNQRADGRMGGSNESTRAITTACAAIVLCREAATGKGVPSATIQSRGAESRSWSCPDLVRSATAAVRCLAEDQRKDGSWGDGLDETRRLSVTVWSVLALKAATRAGFESDPAIARRGLQWIEATVAGIEARPGSMADPTLLPRARACRAVARAATGGVTPALNEDVKWLLEAFERGGTPVLDAETILFGALSVRKCHGTLADDDKRRLKPLLIGTAVRAGCPRGTWTVPSVWSELGGRLVSTALMTWALEIYYAYPDAYGLD